MGRLTQKLRPTKKNLEEIPNQSGIYILYREQKRRPGLKSHAF